MKSGIQSVVFKRKYWTKKRAEQFLKSHNLYPIKDVDRSYPLQYRYRIMPPENFNHFITKKVKDGTIMIVIGFN